MSTTQTTQSTQHPQATQKVAIVTGASQGIGAELVKAYRERGYRVVATARSIRQADDAGVLAVPGDIADPDTARRVVAQAIEAFGRVDTLVNNAGVFIAKPFTAYTCLLYTSDAADDLLTV